MKTLTGADGRVALYALASATGEVVLAFGVSREEAQALARAGAERTGMPHPPSVVLLKDAAAFALSAGRLRWKSIPAQILVDAAGIDRPLAETIGDRLSMVAPVVMAVSEVEEAPGAPPDGSSEGGSSS